MRSPLSLRTSPLNTCFKGGGSCPAAQSVTKEKNVCRICRRSVSGKAATTYPSGPLGQVLWAVRAYVMQTAPVGLLRMSELRNCHIRGNFVTEAAQLLGAGETESAALLSPKRCKRKERLQNMQTFRVWKGGNNLSFRAVRPSTLGERELNFCVRDGNRWILSSIVTAMVYYTLTGVISCE